MTHLRTQHQQGFALITTLIMLIVFLAIITTYTFLTTIETKTSDASVDSATGFYAAESGYNLRAEDIRTVFQDFRRPEGTAPNGTVPCVDGNDGSGAFACVSYELNDRTIHTYVQEDPRNGVDGRATVVSSGDFVGLNAVEFGYNFFSDAYPPNETRPEASIETRLNIQLIPLFQFAVFYDKDLEMHPGQEMKLEGRVHVNGNLYLTGRESGANQRRFDILGQVTAAKRSTCSKEEKEKNPKNCDWREVDDPGGTINTFRKDEPKKAREGVGVFDGDEQRDLTKGITYTSESDEIAAWNERITLGIPPLVVPPVNDFAIDEEATYWSKADLRVLLRVNGNQAPNMVSIEVHDSDGNTNPGDMDVVATTTLNSCVADENAKYPPYIGYRNGDYAFFGEDGKNDEHEKRVFADYPNRIPTAIEWSNTFYDGREDTAMLFMEVDVVGLLNCITANTTEFGFDIDDESGGGLVWYFSVEGPDSDKVNNYGIRIRNGATLAASDNKAPDIAGLTIVSNQALYIQGNYNFAPSDANNTTWKPASFLGDTINILSERYNEPFTKGDNSEGGWDATVSWWNYDTNPEKWRVVPKYEPADSNSEADREANDTTIRAAILGGSDLTGGAEGTGGQKKPYNGGLENFPRLHENWQGSSTSTLTYAGSFVSLGLPQFKDGKWDDNSYYRAPNRIWEYETAFNTPSNLPPLPPMATHLSQGGFTRAYPER